MGRFVLYLFTACAAFACCYAVIPLLQRTLASYLLDHPGGLKKHAQAVPVLGGCGIFLGLCAALIALRFCTQFPTGTLHSLRGILFGGGLIFAMGLWDDCTKPKGLPIWGKLLLQALATLCLIHYGIAIRIFASPWVMYPLTFLWVVGLTNAFNLLDILDGLCTTQALVCTLGLGLIALPSEFIYVNFAAAALIGACLAFLPFNFASPRKVFLGDSGSNLLGFLIAALCLATEYSENSSWGCLTPLFIVAVPLFDIAFVILARLVQGKNPLKGSADHAALRLQQTGYSSRRIVGGFAGVGLACNAIAFMVPRSSKELILTAILLLMLLAGGFGYYLWRLGGTSHAR